MPRRISGYNLDELLPERGFNVARALVGSEGTGVTILEATAHVPNQKDSWPGWEDAAVHPKDLGNYLRDFRKLLNKFDYDASLYGHFGQACVHCRIPFDLHTHDGIETYRAFIDQASDLVVRYNGSFSGEHGDGQSKAIFLPKMYGPELMQAMRTFKGLWDPQWKMNPGKIIDAELPDANLRFGAAYAPWNPETHFKFPEDKGSFANAALRCVGVGKCRRTDHAFMCPSFLATQEEKDTTRGRAHLLFEMVHGRCLPSARSFTLACSLRPSSGSALSCAICVRMSCRGCRSSDSNRVRYPCSETRCPI